MSSTIIIARRLEVLSNCGVPVVLDDLATPTKVLLPAEAKLSIAIVVSWFSNFAADGVLITLTDRAVVDASVNFIAIVVSPLTTDGVCASGSR